MKRLFEIIFCLALFTWATPASADLYTLDYDETAYTSSVSDTFTIDDFSGIDSATLNISLMGRTSDTNSRGDSWYYESIIDVTVGSSLALDNKELTGGFQTLVIDMNALDIADLQATSSLDFSILGQLAYWWSDLSPWGGYSTSRFYLDSVTLDVTPSAVPIPGAVWLLCSGLIGLIGVKRKFRD